MEVEATLLVRAADPAAVRARLEALAGVPGYRFGPAETAAHQDAYFDTPDGKLRGKRAVLRLRSRAGPEGGHVLTFKCAGEAAGAGTGAGEAGLRVEREELELPWSPPAFELVRERIERLGVKLPRAEGAGAAGGDGGPPQPRLLALGLRPVQLRGALRTVREAFAEPSRGDAEPVAELDVDLVTFGGPGLDLAPEDAVPVGHSEVEIELRPGGAPADVDAIARGLLAAFEGELAPWPVSKTALGRWIDEQRRAGRLSAWLDASGRGLKPAAYDALLHESGGRPLEI